MTKTHAYHTHTYGYKSPSAHTLKHPSLTPTHPPPHPPHTLIRPRLFPPTSFGWDSVDFPRSPHHGLNEQPACWATLLWAGCWVACWAALLWAGCWVTCWATLLWAGCSFRSPHPPLGRWRHPGSPGKHSSHWAVERHRNPDSTTGAGICLFMCSCDGDFDILSYDSRIVFNRKRVFW